MPHSFPGSADSLVPTPAQGFDRVAWFYDALAGLVFGRTLRRAQQAALVRLPTAARRVLILGGGTGWVLTEVLRRRPQATVLYLDPSATMLARAAHRLRRHRPRQEAQVEFRHGTQAALRPGEQFDAIITFFVLDCLTPTNLGPALRQLTAAARPGASWLAADFRPPGTWWQRGLLASMYLFFRLTTNLEANSLPDWPAALKAAGWRPGGPAAYFYGGAVMATALQQNLEKV